MTTYPQLPPTAPGQLPLLGHALSFVGGNRRLEFFQELRGLGPVVSITVGPRSFVVVNDHDFIHDLLTGERTKSLSKGLLFEKLKLFGGEFDALPVAEGKEHMERRRLLHPSMHRKQVTGYVSTMSQTIENTIAPWGEGDTLDVKAEMQLITQMVITDALFSTSPSREAAVKILKSVDRVFTTALRRALLPISTLERLPTPGNRRVKEASSVLRQMVEEIIEEHKKNPDAYQDVVSLLLGVTDEHGAGLQHDDILSEITGLLAAGSETTAVVVSWLFHELGRNRDLEERLHEEIDSVLKGDRLTAEHIPQLEFTSRLVNETLRLYTPGWLVTRQALEPMHLGNFKVAAGTDLIFSPYTLHRDPGLYADPRRFDPDRWLPGNQPPKNAFIPFGAGNRKCMGDQFALTEAVAIAALVASRWRLRPVRGSHVRPIGAITTHPSSLQMVTEPRRPSL